MRTRCLASLLLSLPLAATGAWAQLAPSPDAPPVSHAPAQPEDDQPVAQYKIQSSLVDLFFTVKDKSGQLVPHLGQADCSVEEDKQPQKWRNFTAETDLPLTLGIMLDTSGSQQYVLPLEKQAGSQFLEQVLRKKDQAFVLSFDVNVDLLQDFTNSARQLSRSMDKAEINTAGGNGAAGIPGLGGGTIPTQGTPKGTLLYDAIYLATNEKLSQETGRKALIILTDGDDQGSRYKIQEAIAAAQRSNAVIYVILIADTGFYNGFNLGYSGYSAAKKLSEESGGRLINVGNNGKKLEQAFQQIQDELRTQYIGTYVPTNTKLDGTFRHVALNCGEGIHVQVRKGYFAPSPDQSGNGGQ
ncbi:MAG TPA: VWA domain-containing protein [Terracidiphilus sp.]|jgi:VWFA-related protein